METIYCQRGDRKDFVHFIMDPEGSMEDIKSKIETGPFADYFKGAKQVKVYKDQTRQEVITTIEL